MIRVFLCTIVLFGLVFMEAMACDICGCFMGITPYDNQSSVSFVYRYRSFNGYNFLDQKNKVFPAMGSILPLQEDPIASANLFNTSAFKNDPGELPAILHGNTVDSTTVLAYPDSDYELYHAYELRAKYFLHQRLELNVIAPVVMNKARIGATQYTLSGISDITFFSGYHLLRRIEEPVLQQRLIIGAGVKLPIGNYYAKVNNIRADLLMQPGTGSVDYMTYLNYIIAYNRLGLNFNTLLKFNGSNYYHEKIANSSASYVNVFYRFPNDDWAFIPSVQFYHEQTKGLYINDEMIEGTGMNAFMIGPGFDVFYKNISMNTAFQFTAYDMASGENLGSAARVVAGIAYNINQKNYLLSKKQDEE